MELQFRPDPSRKLSAKLYDSEKLISRVNLRNLVHLVGFSIQKTLTLMS